MDPAAGEVSDICDGPKDDLHADVFSLCVCPTKHTIVTSITANSTDRSRLMQVREATSAVPSTIPSTYPSTASSALPSVSGTPIGTTSGGSLSPLADDAATEDDEDAEGEEELDFEQTSGSGTRYAQPSPAVSGLTSDPALPPHPQTGGKGLYKYPPPPEDDGDVEAAAENDPDLYGLRRSVSALVLEH